MGFQLFHSVTKKLTTKASKPSWSCLSRSKEFSLQEIEKFQCLLFYNHNINIWGEGWYQIVLFYYVVCYNNTLCQIQKRQLVSFHFLKVIIHILNQLSSGLSWIWVSWSYIMKLHENLKEVQLKFGWEKSKDICWMLPYRSNRIVCKILKSNYLSYFLAKYIF